MTSKDSEEFEKFDEAIDKIMSVSPEELKRRIAAAKKAKIRRHILYQLPP